MFGLSVTVAFLVIGVTFEQSYDLYKERIDCGKFPEHFMHSKRRILCMVLFLHADSLALAGPSVWIKRLLLGP